MSDTTINNQYFRLFNIDCGGGCGDIVAYTKNKDTARKWKQTSNWTDFDYVEIVIIDTLDDLVKIKSDKLVKSAKAKLTKEELGALIQSIQKQ